MTGRSRATNEGEAGDGATDLTNTGMDVPSVSGKGIHLQIQRKARQTIPSLFRNVVPAFVSLLFLLAFTPGVVQANQPTITAEADNAAATAAEEAARAAIEKIKAEINAEHRRKLANEDITIDGVSTIAALAIASFAVDRFATFFMFILSLLPSVHRWIPDPQYARRLRTEAKALPSSPREAEEATANAEVESGNSEDEVPEAEIPGFVTAEAVQLATFREGLGQKRYYIAYYLFAVAGATILGGLGNLQILRIIGFKGANPWLELPLTVLLLTAGADRIKALLGVAGVGGSEPAEPKPLEITGSLNLEGGDKG